MLVLARLQQTVSLSLTDHTGTQGRGWITLNVLMRMDDDVVAVPA